MGIGILAPVPATILRSAQVACDAQGRVAFGSKAWELFNKIDTEYGQNIPVLIYPTPNHGDPDRLCDPGFATFRGNYLGTKLAQAGKHPDPSVRPMVTVEGPEIDTQWAFFWEVSNLVQVSKQDRVAITSLTAEGQKKPLTNKFVLKGPMLVKAPFL